MNLSGTWYNELGSQMTITVQGQNIAGTYHTVAGDATGQYNLIGFSDTDNDESQCIGFVVVWQNSSGSSDSVTTWSGQARMVDNVEIIVTTWLLSIETEVDDAWHSTLIGHDLFSRTEKNAESIADKIKLGLKHSYPSKKLNS